MRADLGSVEWGAAASWIPRDVGVDLWCGDLLYSPGDERVLTMAERERAERFIVRARGQAFVAGRSALRRVLARYVGGEPRDLTFEYGPHGKPSLPAEDAAIRFNLSHSGDKFLLAVSRECEVGVDIEELRTERRLVEIGKRFFAPEEHARMCAEGPDGISDYFYRLWACKEAYLKLHGTGFSFPASDFCVALEPGAPRIEWTRLREDVPSRWRMERIDLAFEGYRAALCSEREGELRAFVAAAPT